MRRSRPFSRPQSWAKIRHTNRVNQIYLLGWRWTYISFFLPTNDSLPKKEPRCYLLCKCIFASKWKPDIFFMLLNIDRYGTETWLSELVYIIVNHRKTYRKTNIRFATQCHWSSISYLTVFFRNHQFSSCRSHLLRFKKAIEACSIRRNSLKVSSFVLLNNKTLKSELW